MTAVEQIITEKIPHGDIWIGFTPDEEVGSGADLFDLDYFKAKFAYTVDGDYEGEVAYENFNAASASFEITGVNVHPGEAKDIMINAALVGCEIASLLPENETPAHTEGREGFYHLTDFSPFIFDLVKKEPPNGCIPAEVCNSSTFALLLGVLSLNPTRRQIRITVVKFNTTGRTISE